MMKRYIGNRQPRLSYVFLCWDSQEYFSFHSFVALDEAALGLTDQGTVCRKAPG